jgi:hypothetical protein
MGNEIISLSFDRSGVYFDSFAGYIGLPWWITILAVVVWGVRLSISKGW